MAAIFFAYPIKSDDATLSGGAWSTTLPLENMQTRVIAEVARSAGVDNAQTQFDVDFGRSTRIGAVAIVNHNLTVNARVRITASVVSDWSSTVYDSGWLSVWPAIYTTELLEWEEDNWWSGQLTPDQMGTSRPVYVHVCNAYGWYWRIEFDDTTNSDGYIEVGRLIMAPAWQPDRGVSYGATLQWVPETEVSTSLGGTRYYAPKTTGRRARYPFEWLTSNEAYAGQLEMQRRLGIHGELLVVEDSDAAETLQQRSFLATVESISPIKQLSATRFAVEVQLREAI